jgi:small neutral amino acid transporter SnatA (MarC family)
MNKNLGMEEDEMEDDAPTVNLTDEDGRSLICYVERSLEVEGKEYVLLLPVDNPIEIFAWEADEDNEEEEMLVDIEEDELEEVFSTARAVLAEQELTLQRTALTLTASGELPEVVEDDVITLDIEDEDGQPNIEQFQQLAAFFHEEQEYVVCTPLDPLLFFARMNPKGNPELLSIEEFQTLLSLDEFKAIQSHLESEAQFSDEAGPGGPSPDATAPLNTPSASDPVVSTKQRIADSIARTPIEAPVKLFNLFIIFFVTLGPLKIIPPFVQLTQKADPSMRRRLALRSAALATVVILLVAIIGQNIVQVWQIRLPSLLIAGGILLFLVALNLVMTQYQPPPLPADSPPPSLNLVVTPLTFPVILPPFGIAIALVLMLASQEMGFNPLTLLGVLVLVMLLNLICMLAARPILAFVKPVTLQIFGFVLGLLQMALGIELIITGLEIEALVLRRLLGF